MNPCELLIIHRDAESADPGVRYEEIAAANLTGVKHVAVVPVRMQEAWLLLDESAIRRAASRPSSTEPLHLPPARKWDTLPDPKDVLHSALRSAHGATGRRARRFNVHRATHQVAEFVSDWTPLRALDAFVRFERDLIAALEALG